jgi:coenzyme F420-0:L-glutamate ligase/coenzyme F420-1:gamma-L-glutamate ligase
VSRLEVIGLTGLPEIEPGADLPRLLAGAWRTQVGAAESTDVLVVAQKIVSKAEGCLVSLADVEPSALAACWARQHGKDPRLVEIVLREARRVVRMDRGVLIVETRHGSVCANAGVDTSNVPPGRALTLPRDPDASARALREGMRDHLGVTIGVVIADTFGRPWREGLTNVAIGLAGVQPLEDHRGAADAFGRRLQVSVLATADEMASAAELVMGKTRGIPAAVIRGLDVRAENTTARQMVRPGDHDLFR